MLYIGIDPGETWCGFAALEIAADGTVRVEARTYVVAAHGGYLGMAVDLLDLLPHTKKTHVIVEDFRVRNSGHQRFAAANTLRMIGALEYGAHCINAFDFSLIPPSDNGAAEVKELFGRIIWNYRQRWPQRAHPAWGHCLSAWRVLGHWMMHNEQAVLLGLHKHRRSFKCHRWLPVLLKNAKQEHVAPAAYWHKR